jgi:hypothetical protein
VRERAAPVAGLSLGSPGASERVIRRCIMKNLLRSNRVAGVILAAAFGCLSCATHWSKQYGSNTEEETAYSMESTSDGGYILAGRTTFPGAGNYDVWVVKLNAGGSLIWHKIFGGADEDVARSVQPTADGGYVVAGWTRSFGAAGYDVWVVKLASSGDISWQKRYGGPNEDKAFSIVQAADGGYAVAGSTNSWGGGGDIWVLKLDPGGNISWQRSYGSAYGFDRGSAIRQTSDGGYVVAGYTSDVFVGGGAGVLRLDGSGNLLWLQMYHGAAETDANSVGQTVDGGYIVAGYHGSYVGDNADFWVLKLGPDGAVAWQKTYGGRLNDEAKSVRQTTDGGYVVGGVNFSFGMGRADAWVLKLDASGNVSWNKTYGGPLSDVAYSTLRDSRGYYLTAGYSDSFGPGAGFGNFWVVKANGSGDITEIDCPIVSAPTPVVNDTHAAATLMNASQAATRATAGDTTANVTTPAIPYGSACRQ